MNALAHLLLGLFAAAIAAPLLAPETAFSMPVIAAAALGALAPDLDHRKTKLFKALLAVVFGCTAALCFQFVRTLYGLIESLGISIAAGALAAIAAFLLKPRHRGFTHSLAALALFTAGAYALAGWSAALAGGAAYASHLLSDGVIKAI